MFKYPDWQRENWSDCPDNPVIGTFDMELKKNTAIGDPQVLVPGEFDDKWHCFYHGFFGEGFVPYYHHAISEDGVSWRLKRRFQWPNGPSFIFKDNGRWYLYFTHILRGRECREHNDATNIISVKYTDDFETFSETIKLLCPELSWEREYDSCGYKAIQARNPCVVKMANGKYRMYYSAGTVFLKDCGYEEPKYISFAESDSPLGPFIKYGSPVLSPDRSIEYRNQGAGAIKVFGYGDKYIALYNSIYNDGHSHSAINTAMSDDGISFTEAPYNPILPPCGSDWKKEFVYQLDLVRCDGNLRIYYNGRSEWNGGTEQIGFSELKNDNTPVKKLW